jgi:hypothetical protein
MCGFAKFLEHFDTPATLRTLLEAYVDLEDCVEREVFSAALGIIYNEYVVEMFHLAADVHTFFADKGTEKLPEIVRNEKELLLDGEPTAWAVHNSLQCLENYKTFLIEALPIMRAWAEDSQGYSAHE